MEFVDHTDAQVNDKIDENCTLYRKSSQISHNSRIYMRNSKDNAHDKCEIAEKSPEADDGSHTSQSNCAEDGKAAQNDRSDPENVHKSSTGRPGRPKKKKPEPTPCTRGLDEVARYLAEMPSKDRPAAKERSREAARKEWCNLTETNVLDVLVKETFWRTGLVTGKSARDIGHAIGKTGTTARTEVSRALTGLFNKGLIVREISRDAAKKMKPNRYAVAALAPEEWRLHGYSVSRSEGNSATRSTSLFRRQKLPQSIQRKELIREKLNEFGDFLDVPCPSASCSTLEAGKYIPSSWKINESEGTLEAQELDPRSAGASQETLGTSLEEEERKKEESNSLRSLDSRPSQNSKTIDAQFDEVENKAPEPVESQPGQLTLVQPITPTLSTAVAKRGKGKAIAPPRGTHGKFDYGADFETFWNDYPKTRHKKRKCECWVAFVAIIDGQVEDQTDGGFIEITADELIERTRQHAQHMAKARTPAQYVPAPLTWLADTVFWGEQWEAAVEDANEDPYASYRRDQEAKAKVTQEARAKYPLQQSGAAAVGAAATSELSPVEKLVNRWAAIHVEFEKADTKAQQKADLIEDLQSGDYPDADIRVVYDMLRNNWFSGKARQSRRPAHRRVVEIVKDQARQRADIARVEAALKTYGCDLDRQVELWREMSPTHHTSPISDYNFRQFANGEDEFAVWLAKNCPEALNLNWALFSFCYQRIDDDTLGIVTDPAKLILSGRSLTASNWGFTDLEISKARFESACDHTPGWLAKNVA